MYDHHGGLPELEADALPAFRRNYQSRRPLGPFEGFQRERIALHGVFVEYTCWRFGFEFAICRYCHYLWQWLESTSGLFIFFHTRLSTVGVQSCLPCLWLQWDTGQTWNLFQIVHKDKERLNYLRHGEIASSGMIKHFELTRLFFSDHLWIIMHTIKLNWVIPFVNPYRLCSLIHARDLFSLGFASSGSCTSYRSS